MTHDRLAELMQAHQDAIAALQEESTSVDVHATILGILQALGKGDITKGRAIRLLGLQSLSADEPTQVALYRQAATIIRRTPREM